MKEHDLQIGASKLFRCRDVLECIFDLNPLEIAVFRLLNREGALSAHDVAIKLGKDRSTAYRILRRLQACRIVFKKTESLEQGGYRHMFNVVEPEKLSEDMRLYLDDWYEKMHGAVERFPTELRISLENEE